MTKSKRKIINVQVSTESVYEILDQKSPEEAVKRLWELQAEYGERKVFFNVSSYGYDGGSQLELWETREENDKEFNVRSVAEAKAREKEKARKLTATDKEFKEYLRLQKKFQGKTEF